MNVLLTGATGLIGNALGPKLVGLGHDVRVLARDPEKARAALSFPAPIWLWNGELAPPQEALLKVDAVVHLAGENVAAKRWTKERKQQLVTSRVQSTKNLTSALAKAGVTPKVFVSASGIGVFGSRGDQVLDESSAPGDDFLAELCQAWEAASHTAGADRVVQLRFGAVLSLQAGFLKEVAHMVSRFGGSRLGTGRQWLSWIHLDDALEVLLLTLTNAELTGPVNVVAPHSLTNVQFTKQLTRVLKSFPAPPAPQWALRLLFGELSQALLGSQRAIPEKLIRSGFQWKYPDMTSALNSFYGNARD